MEEDLENAFLPDPSQGLVSVKDWTGVLSLFFHNMKYACGVTEIREATLEEAQKMAFTETLKRLQRVQSIVEQG